MRDSNYKSIPQNKAAVSITTNLYDRRALDSTCDQPLVNSLNHLTFLTSSSAKVRETLANDGGLERLVCILHECKKDSNLLRSQQLHKKKTIKEEKQSALIAWKWTLAFQCLVLVGTRGTEHIRKRVVEAGIIPIIATVLDNYLLIVRNFDNETDSNFNQNFLEMLSAQLHNTLCQQDDNDNENINENDKNNDDDYDLSKILNKDSELYQYLKHRKSKSLDSINSDLEVSQASIEENLHDINDKISSPRVFLNGILVPKDDDVVWSLQLLAFISKYSVLKDLLQFTHLIDTLSLRPMIGRKEIDRLSPLLEQDTFNRDADADYDLISNDSSDDQSKSTQLTQSILVGTSSQIQSQIQSQIEPATQESSTILINNDISSESIVNSKNIIIPNLHQLSSSSSLSSDSSIHSSTRASKNSHHVDPEQEELITSSSPSSLSKSTSIYKKLHFMKNTSQAISRSLINSLTRCESNCKMGSGSQNDEKIFNLNELNVKLSYFYERCKSNEKSNSIKKTKLEGKQYYSKWNYESYFDDQSNLKLSADFNKESLITHPLNIFPLVEKFTIRSINTTDMCYWSGVIMRNSCRKDEKRGGVRQCASFDCGKWESYPRQFAKCRRCKRTKYCSKDCQLKAWVYHKNWCVDSNASSNGHSHTPRSAEGIDGADGPVTGTTTAVESETASRDEMVPAQLNETL